MGFSVNSFLTTNRNGDEHDERSGKSDNLTDSLFNE